MATRKTPTKTTDAAPVKGAAAKTSGRTDTKTPSKPEAKTAVRAAPAARKGATPSSKSPDASVASAPAPSAAERGATVEVAATMEAPAGEARYRWIAHAAYLRAERRGFAPGQEVEDWLAAEAEFLTAHGLAKD